MEIRDFTAPALQLVIDSIHRSECVQGMEQLSPSFVHYLVYFEKKIIKKLKIISNKNISMQYSCLVFTYGILIFNQY